MSSLRLSTNERGPHTLNGQKILVTRPAGQAERLCRRIASAGGMPVRFAGVEIHPVQDPAAVASRLQHLRRFDLAIFISANAVHYGLDPIRAVGGLPAGLELAAVGRATARALGESGHPPTLVPERGYDSEALLASPRLKRVAGQRIIIFRGEGGRALLGATLQQRGAEVFYAEVYRRVCPESLPGALLVQWPQIAVVTVTSNEILDNLVGLFGESGFPLLRDKPLLVISRRMAEHAEALGFPRLLEASGADDEAILEALVDYFREY